MMNELYTVEAYRLVGRECFDDVSHVDLGSLKIGFDKHSECHTFNPKSFKRKKYFSGGKEFRFSVRNQAGSVDWSVRVMDQGDVAKIYFNAIGLIK